MSTLRARLANDPAMPRVGDTIADRYRVEALIGEGGFAAVFRATDARTGQTVAIKVLDPFMSRRPELAARFEREVAVVSRLKHHNTIKVFDTGRTEGECLFLVMELLDGTPLDELLAASGPLAEARVHRIAVQVLKSLAEAHAQGVVHRDLKPANLFHVRMVGEDDYVKVLDFGIAKASGEDGEASLTQTGEVMCSPPYVAPERIAGRAGPESDLYSLGVVMIELLTGRPPYVGETPMAVMIQHASSDEVPVPDALREGALGEVLRRALAKPLEARYASAIEMLEALQRVTEGLRTEPLPAPLAGRITMSPPAISTGAVNTLHASAMNTGAVTRALDASTEGADRGHSRGPLVAVIAALSIAAVALAAYVVPMLRTSPVEAPETGSMAPPPEVASAAAPPADPAGSEIPDDDGRAAPARADDPPAAPPGPDEVAAQAALVGRATANAAQSAVRGGHETRALALRVATVRAVDEAAREERVRRPSSSDRAPTGDRAVGSTRDTPSVAPPPDASTGRAPAPTEPVAVTPPATATSPAAPASTDEPANDGGRRIRPVAPR